MPSVFENLFWMKANNEYQIPYLGLKLGKHQFEFTLTDSFFEQFELSEIHHAHMEIDVTLEKQSSMMVLDIAMSGDVQTTCDRCNDDLVVPVDIEERLIVKFGDETGSTDDDILIHGPSEHAIDLSQYFYEYAHLALPPRQIHETEAECNQESLRALEKYRAEVNTGTQWAALKNLNYEDPEDREMDEGTDFFDEEED